jgi:uncharacterized protein (DUF952 family)
MRIFHIVAPDVWATAVTAGVYEPASIATEGFVHFSFAEQVAGTANLRYHDQPDLMVIEIDPLRIDAELVVEDSYGTGTEFPHVYGAIPTDAALATHPLTRDGAGNWTFSPLDGPRAPSGAGASASPDH